MASLSPFVALMIHGCEAVVLEFVLRAAEQVLIAKLGVLLSLG